MPFETPGGKQQLNEIGPDHCIQVENKAACSEACSKEKGH